MTWYMSEVVKDWAPIQLPNDLKLLRLMLQWQEWLDRDTEMTEPMRRKIARLEAEQQEIVK